MSPAEEGLCVVAHKIFTPLPDLHRKHGFNLRTSKYIRFSTTKLKEKNGPKNIYLYSSHLYITLKSKCALAGNGKSEKGVTYCKWLLNCKH